jgi:phage terminase small subunit
MARDTLTPKQEAFAAAYVLSGNASDAYRQAYDAKRMSAQLIAEEASKLLRHPKVAPRVAQLQAKVVAVAERKFDITAERIAEELAALAFFNPADLYDADGNLIPVKDLPRNVAAALSKIEQYEEYAGRGDEREAVGVVKKVQWHDQKAALETLGKWSQIRMWVTQTESGQPGEFDVPRGKEAAETIERIRRESKLRRGVAPVPAASKQG